MIAKHLLHGIAGLLLAWAPNLSAGTIEFPKYGFHIDALDQTAGAATTQALMMFLPVENGFAPNVNVQIQPFPGTIEEYIKVTKGQFTEMSLKLNFEKLVSKNEWLCEYSGSLKGGKAMHWYAKVVVASGKAYLATATTLEESWKAEADLLKKNVESFGVK